MVSNFMASTKFSCRLLNAMKRSKGDVVTWDEHSHGVSLPMFWRQIFGPRSRHGHICEGVLSKDQAQIFFY